MLQDEGSIRDRQEAGQVSRASSEQGGLVTVGQGRGVMGRGEHLTVVVTSIRPPGLAHE